MQRGLALLASVGLVSLAMACDKKSDVVLAESASAVQVVAPPPSAKVVPFTIDPASKSSIDMPAPNEHIKADTTAAAGKLDVDLMNVENTRGEVKIDLTTLTTHTFTDDEKNKGQTNHAHNWLEAGDLVDAQTKEANRYAVFGIQSIDGASAKDVTKVTPTKEGNDEVRTVTLTAHGEFLVHGRKVKKDAALEVRFVGPAGAPVRIDVKTTAPFKVLLAEHDVKPRDNFGKLAQKSLSLVSKVAETADITLDLHAVPVH